ncbi:MAG: hypothetical protein EAX96_05990 [Candidatus Lokiarchaeota archaeon]|nr:hypothetical protein [Candidatus Lokiarchaeota archaeon]
MTVLNEITDEKLLKNIRIIREYFMENARQLTTNVTKFLKNQDTLMKLDTAFDLIVGPQEEIKASNYLDIILLCSVKYLEDKDLLNEIIDKNFKKYLNFETVASNMKKKHLKFKEIEPLERELFKTRIITYAGLLEGDGDDYFEISRSAYPSKEGSLKRAKVEINLEQEIANVMKENRSMIMAPGIIKLEVLEATLFTFEYVHKKILEEIDQIYG